MSLGWLYCSKCFRYIKKPEVYSDWHAKAGYPLDCGHSSHSPNVPDEMHRFETDDQFDDWWQQFGYKNVLPSEYFQPHKQISLLEAMYSSADRYGY